MAYLLNELRADRDRIADQLKSTESDRTSLEERLGDAAGDVEQLRAGADRALALAREIVEIYEQPILPSLHRPPTTNDARAVAAPRTGQQRAVDTALALCYRIAAESRIRVAADGAWLLRAADARLGLSLRQAPRHADGARERADGGVAPDVRRHVLPGACNSWPATRDSRSGST